MQTLPLQRLQAWVTSGSQNPSMNVLPAHSFVLRVHLDVEEAFNGGAGNTLTVGYDDDQDAIMTSISVSSTGLKSPTLGALGGYNSTSRNIEAYYNNTGDEPTTGSCFVLVEYMLVPPRP